MHLASGRNLSSYEILGPLGAGGMGEVWRARDTRLDRVVALKVLPPEMAADAERMARFEREARALAALQHPNIVTVHSVEEADGLHFLTMELVPGETLTETIAAEGPGGMPLARFYPLAAAIAEAVHAAHRKGITHRDLKPDNVIVGESGRPKVLDFGLAKLEQPPTPDGRGSSTLTGEGHALGTIPYMAPEALKAGDVDARSDVFSLGVVLYELLTGAHPFPADDPGERISAILRDAPAPATAHRRDVPPELARLLRRCLEKDHDRRLQTALDLRNELEELAAGAPGKRAAAARRPWGVVLAVAATIAIAVSAAWWLKPERKAKAYVPRPMTARSGLIGDPSWSPGAESIAFSQQVSGSLDIYVMPASGVDAELRVSGPGDESMPRWSPDGSTLAYMSTLDPACPIYLLRSRSAPPARLFDTRVHPLQMQDIPDVMGDRPWDRSGTWLLASRVTESDQLAIFRVDVSDGSSRQLTHPPPGCHDGAASFSFDGTRVAFERRSLGASSLWTMDPDGTGATRLLEEEPAYMRPAWRPDGERLVFASIHGGGETDLWELDTTTGSLEQLTFSTHSVFGHTVSVHDRIAYSSFWHDTFLHVVDVETGEIRQLTDHPGNNGTPRFSPSGNEVAYDSDRDGDSELWILDLERGSERQVTFTDALDEEVDWSPDGEHLVFRSDRDGRPALYVASRDGGGQRLLVEQPGQNVRWSPDGAWIGYVDSTAAGQALWCVRPDGSDAHQLLEHVSAFDWVLDSRRVVLTGEGEDANALMALDLESGERRVLWRGKLAEVVAAPDGSAVAFLHGEGHQGMGLALLRLAPPTAPANGGGSAELPTPLDAEPRMVVRARDRWHVHLGGWSPDSQRIVYIRDEDYSDIYELVERE